MSLAMVESRDLTPLRRSGRFPGYGPPGGPTAPESARVVESETLPPPVRFTMTQDRVRNVRCIRAARPSRGVAACFILAVATAPVPAHATAQVVTAVVDENFRAEPNGAIVAVILTDTPLSVARSSGAWAEAELEGWVWAPSVQSADRNGYSLVVAASGGENLRREPRGRIVARLMEGALLDELDRRPGWIRVRRVGWIWEESVAPSPAPPASDPSRPATPLEPAATSQGSAAVLTVPGRGLPILSSPDGDTLAHPVPGADIQVLGREGGWARVRIEGWAWISAPADSSETVIAAPLEVDPGVVTREPDRYRGRAVRWTLQFVSVERAERVRTDFYEGEPFLLTRPAGGGGGFVYVAVPPERMAEFQDLTPLESIEVVGRIRSGSSGLTGSPILDLIELRRTSRR